MHHKKGETLKYDKISATIEEDLAYESDGSDEAWVVDFVEDGDKEHSDSTIGDMSVATIVQQRQGKRIDSSLPPFHLTSGLQHLI